MSLIRNFPTRASLRLNGSKSSEFSLVAACCRLGQSGSPRGGKRTDSLVKVENGSYAIMSSSRSPRS